MISDEKNIKLCKNILEELRKNNINLFEKEKISIKDKEELDNIIDFSKLNIEEKSDVKYIIKIITMVTRTTSMDVIKRNITKEEGRRILVKEFEILKQGMIKK